MLPNRALFKQVSVPAHRWITLLDWFHISEQAFSDRKGYDWIGKEKFSVNTTSNPLIWDGAFDIIIEGDEVLVAEFFFCLKAAATSYIDAEYGEWSVYC